MKSQKQNLLQLFKFIKRNFEIELLLRFKEWEK